MSNQVPNTRLQGSESKSQAVADPNIRANNNGKRNNTHTLDRLPVATGPDAVHIAPSGGASDLAAKHHHHTVPAAAAKPTSEETQISKTGDAVRASKTSPTVQSNRSLHQTPTPQPSLCMLALFPGLVLVISLVMVLGMVSDGARQAMVDQQLHWIESDTHRLRQVFDEQGLDDLQSDRDRMDQAEFDLALAELGLETPAVMERFDNDELEGLKMHDINGDGSLDAAEFESAVITKIQDYRASLRQYLEEENNIEICRQGPFSDPSGDGDAGGVEGNWILDVISSSYSSGSDDIFSTVINIILLVVFLCAATFSAVLIVSSYISFLATCPLIGLSSIGSLLFIAVSAVFFVVAVAVGARFSPFLGLLTFAAGALALALNGSVQLSPETCVIIACCAIVLVPAALLVSSVARRSTEQKDKVKLKTK